MLLEGLFLPLTTPFYPDGRLYLRKLEHNAERYSRTLAAGLAILTPTGEADRLSDDERRQALASVAGATARETLLLADVSHAAVAGCLHLAEIADGLLYDAALLRLPAALPLLERRTLAQAVADRSPLRIVLLEERGEALEEELITEMAGHPQVMGWVATASSTDAIARVLARTSSIRREVTVTPIFAAVTRRMAQQRSVAGKANFITAESLTVLGGTALASAPPEPALKTRRKTVGFQVLAGRTSAALEVLRVGGGGALLPFGVCSPQACYELFAAWKDDDQALASEKHERIARAAETIEDKLGPAGLKAGCDLNGYFGGPPRLPGLPLQRETTETIQKMMRGMRN